MVTFSSQIQREERVHTCPAYGHGGRKCRIRAGPSNRVLAVSAREQELPAKRLRASEDKFTLIIQNNLTLGGQKCFVVLIQNSFKEQRSQFMRPVVPSGFGPLQFPTGGLHQHSPPAATPQGGSPTSLRPIHGGGCLPQWPPPQD